jgi:LPXTG-site transpeptidase (sortase) family protein
MHPLRLVLACLTLIFVGGLIAVPNVGAAPGAPPSVAPTPAPPKPLAPVRMSVPAIKLDRKLVSVGLDKNRIPIVPNHDIGWYNLSARPGEGENIVFWGHVLRFRQAPKKPAPFARLKELKVGDELVLYNSKGTAFHYQITEQIWVTPDQVEYILPVGSERVTLVSCIGDKVIQGKEVVEMTHRLITIAEPVS